MESSEKIQVLRSVMRQNEVDYLLISSACPHFGDETPSYWRTIWWLTGFSGSNAFVILSHSFAGLWTDSRYLIQARRQLSGTGVEIMMPAYKESSYFDWLSANVKEGNVIAFDGFAISADFFRKLKDRLQGKTIRYKSDFNPFDELWTNRPSIPDSVAWEHDLQFTGNESEAKIKTVRREMNRTDIDKHLLTSPDDIMWLLNIRGGDMDYDPVVLSYFLLGKGSACFFADLKKIPDGIERKMSSMGISVEPYGNIAVALQNLEPGSVLLADETKLSVTLLNSIPGSVKITYDKSIPAAMKAVKNLTEISNIEETMIKDGIVLTKFFFWFENSIDKLIMDEKNLSQKLTELRKQQEGFLMSSFRPIIAFNENAALPHYETGSGLSATIGDRGILLVDSGGHYIGGTTDTTRTIMKGLPSIQQKRDFTMVLKGHIALATAKFPIGTKGYQLDVLARKVLWENGLNYGHGTGHGVGYCLSVHEGPCSISPASNETAIIPGMLLSNEPAVYREGEYGIRTENLMVCYEDEETEFGRFLKFDTVTLCYIDALLIDKSLMDSDEISWLNAYHDLVYTKLSPYLSTEEKAWLKEKTKSP